MQERIDRMMTAIFGFGLWSVRPNPRHFARSGFTCCFASWPEWTIRHCKLPWTGSLMPTFSWCRACHPMRDYRFKHALIQDAAYENLLKSRRLILHRRVGETLRDKFAGTAAAEPELLAHHFTQAGMIGAAIEWWDKAGQLCWLSEPLSCGALRYIARAASQFPDCGYVRDRARRTRLMKLIGEPAWFGFHVANDCR